MTKIEKLSFTSATDARIGQEHPSGEWRFATELHAFDPASGERKTFTLHVPLTSDILVEVKRVDTQTPTGADGGGVTADQARQIAREEIALANRGDGTSQ